MGQRLVREKARIREASIEWAVPGAAELPARLEAVLDGIYAAYGSGWDDVGGADPRRRGLTAEALALGRMVRALLPDEPEAMGLLALMLHCEARRAARRDDAGRYVPLDRQDAGRWSARLIEEAERTLRAAARAECLGRFQLEAAIQSAHAHRAVSGRTDWEAIAVLYEGLLRCAPPVGARVGHAAALGEARGWTAGLAALEGLSADDVAGYQPYWALRGHMLCALGRRAEARAAYERAIGLSEDRAVREFLLAAIPLAD
jgi:RNA polymerase sigma-70 factor (ECF subfamily)